MLAFTLRPARDEDTDAVLALCLATVGVEDFIPSIWDDWLAEAGDAVTVATSDDAVVGVMHLVMVTPEEGCIEGVRVAPAYQDRGVLSALIQHGVQQARERGAAVVRTATEDTNRAHQEVLLGAGFTQVGTFVRFEGPTLGAKPDLTLTGQIRHPGPEALEALWAWLESSSLSIAALSGGLLMEGDWPAALTDDALSRFLAAGEVWTVEDWGEMQSLMIAGPRQVTSEESRFTIRYLDGAVQGIGQLALSVRALAADEHFAEIDARPPDLLILHDALNGAGLTRTEPAIQWIFAKDLG
jgi:N-acetylglutamate synthase-like GNAT family acetyltransferase